MSRFLVLNFQDFGLEHNISESIQSQSLFCICCLRKDGQFYKLSSCNHKRYLDLLNQLQTKLSIKEVVCAHCHSMLKRIETFREQIEQSYKILEEVLSASEIRTVKNISFQIKKTVDIDIQPIILPIQKQKSTKTTIIVRKIKPKIGTKTTNQHDVQQASESIQTTSADMQDPLQIHEPFVDVEISAKKLSGTVNMSADVKSSADVKLSSDDADPIDVKRENKEVPIKMEVKLEPLDTDNECDNEIAVTNTGRDSEYEGSAPGPSKMKVKRENKEVYIKMEVKSEPLDTDNECDNEIAVTNTEPPIQHDAVQLNPTQKPSRSKITTVTLTKEELAKERLQVAQSEEYLKHPFKCEYCLIGFNYEDNLKDHSKRRHGPKAGSVTCEICLQVLYPPGSITAHSYRHYARSQCEECGARFQHYDAALQHGRLAHGKGKPKRTWRCRHCDYTSENQKQLTAHKLKHEQFPCKDCGLVMASQASYRRHLFFIHKKTPRKCSPCNKQFESVSAYEAHMRGHGGEDARCEPCGVRFNTWHAYNAHWLHSAAHAKKSDKYKCADCSATFATAAYLRAHARGRHQRAHAHHCHHCSKAFVLALEMKRHIRKVHNERAVSVCDYCQKSYRNRVHLRRHIQEAHSDKLKKTVEVAPSEKPKKNPQ